MKLREMQRQPGLCVFCDGPLPVRVSGRAGRPRLVCLDTECLHAQTRFYDIAHEERRRSAGVKT